MIGEKQSCHLLDDIFAAESVIIHFQPLVAARTQGVMGLEALGRGVDPHTGRIIPPGELFALARDDPALIDLDRLCRKKALEAFRDLGAQAEGLILSLNFEAALLDKGVVGSGHLIHLVRQMGLNPSRIIIEVVESRVGDLNALRRFVADHKGYGFLVALDDLGSGHSNLERIAILQPDVLKIDRSLIADLDRLYYKQEVTRALLNMSRKIGALVVAEGVEREEEALAALEMGVDVLQGFYFARPGPGLEGVPACRRGIQGTVRRFKDYLVDKVAAKKAQHRLYDAIVTGITGELGRLDPGEFDASLARLICDYACVECLYVLDDQGLQISRTVCDAGRLDPKRQAIFWPADLGTDQSLKNYYLLLKAGLERYVSAPYISLASGNLCVTISRWFQDRDGARRILCADFDADLQPAAASLA